MTTEIPFLNKIKKEVCLNILALATGLGVSVGFLSFEADYLSRFQNIKNKYPPTTFRFTDAYSQAMVKKLDEIPHLTPCYTDLGSNGYDGSCIDYAKLQLQEEQKRIFRESLDRTASKIKYEQGLLDDAILPSIAKSGALTVGIAFLISQGTNIVGKNFCDS